MSSRSPFSPFGEDNEFTQSSDDENNDVILENPKQRRRDMKPVPEQILIPFQEVNTVQRRK